MRSPYEGSGLGLKFFVVVFFVLDLPASAVDTPPPLVSHGTTVVASCRPMYYLPAAAGVSSSSTVLPPDSIASAASRQMATGDVSCGMEWYSGDSNRPQRTLPTEGPRIDMLDPAELVDISGLLPRSAANSGDLGSIDMADWLDDILQPGCGMSGDFTNVADDCDLCSPADGVRATFEKLMEVTTSNS